jgi:adenylate cyclase class 2
MTLPRDRARETAVTETEIKIRWDGPAHDAQALIERHGYQLTGARVLEIDQLFDRASGELKQSDKVLRLRLAYGHETTRARVTYKGPASREGYKSREEIEFDVSDPDAFIAVLDRLGYQQGFRYEKYRTKFSAPHESGIVTLDETPIGVFLELEGAKDWIDRTASRLGFPPAAYLTVSYAFLYRQHGADNPGASVNMTFASPRLQYSDKTTLERPKSID